jgi:hypothetical protein
MTRWLDLNTVREICFEFVIQFQWRDKEPIPPIDSRYSGKLESCLASPKQRFGGKLLYPTLVDQASILFYLLNKKSSVH